jgi:transposase
MFRKSKGGKKRQVRKDPTVGLAVANPDAAAIDVGCTEHWVAVRADRAPEQVRKFGCFTADLEALAQWLKECKVDTVVMEATGNYWVVLYDILEGHQLRPVVVNPRYAKNMSGKKRDISDCLWMQKLHTYGLFANSFRPEESFRTLRAYLRQRQHLVQAASQCIQHMQSALTEMNIQLTNVISDISGETGLRIIDAILTGERDPKQLLGLKDRRIKATDQELMAALQGHWKAEQLFILEQSRLSFTHYYNQMEECERRTHDHMRTLKSRLPQVPARDGEAASTEVAKPAPDLPGDMKIFGFNLSAELRRITGADLTTIDGIGPITAQIVLSEIGTDMSPWPTEKHFASWLGLCPDHRISGGRVLGRATRPVVSRARNALRIAAYGLQHSKSALGAKYRRLRARLGAPKAIIAMAHQLARLIYLMIKHGQDYVDKGVEAYEERFREQQVRWLEKKAQELNMKLVAA